MMNAMLQMFDVHKDVFSWTISWRFFGGKRTNKAAWFPFAVIGLFEAMGLYWTVRAYAWLWDVLRSGVIPY